MMDYDTVHVLLSIFISMAPMLIIFMTILHKMDRVHDKLAAKIDELKQQEKK